jgi:thioredoxin 1
MANEVSDSTFEQEVLKSSEPVLVDFFAEWCGPCKAMAPALEQVAQEMQGKVKVVKGKVKVVKVDVDQNPKVTGDYGIRAMPTLLLFKNGQVAAQHTGALVQKKKLEDWINTSVTATA